MHLSKIKEATPPSSGQLSPVNQTVSSQVPVSTQATGPVRIPTPVTPNGSSAVTSSSYGDSAVTNVNAPVPPLLRQIPFGPPPPSESLSLFSDSGFPPSRHLKVAQQNLTGMNFKLLIFWSVD